MTPTGTPGCGEVVDVVGVTVAAAALRTAASDDDPPGVGAAVPVGMVLVGMAGPEGPPPASGADREERDAWEPPEPAPALVLFETPVPA